MLEDDYLDVLGKAVRGCGMSEQELQTRIGAAEHVWRAFMAGAFSVTLARQCAHVLGLGSEAVARHPAYHPRPLVLDGVRQLVMPFGSHHVNGWWLQSGDACLLFDTGCGNDDLAAVLPGTPAAVFITHGHRDHTGGVRFMTQLGVPVFSASEVAGASTMEVPLAYECGPFRLEALDVSGHFTPASAYLVHGLTRPLMVVGDALFAGSIGKTASTSDYKLALDNLHRALDGQADDLVILPGHGPATTWGEEKRANPFLAGLTAEELS